MAEQKSYHPLKVRAATVAQLDHEFFVKCKDSQMEWLSSVGSGKQWEGVTTHAQDLARARKYIERGEANEPWSPEWCRAYVAESNGTPVATLVLDSKAPEHVGLGLTEQNKKDPFIYLTFLISNRDAGELSKGSGTALINFAKEQARSMGINRICLDCWRGNDGKLVKYYEKQGFVILKDFDASGLEVEKWPGCVLETRL